MNEISSLFLAVTDAKSKEEGAFIAKCIHCLIKVELDVAKARMDVWDIIYNSYKIYAGLQPKKEAVPLTRTSGCCAPSFPEKLSSTKPASKKAKKIRTTK